MKLWGPKSKGYKRRVRKSMISLIFSLKIGLKSQIIQRGVNKGVPFKFETVKID